MTVAEMVAQIKAHSRIGEAGMILCHNGIVRGTSRGGKRVSEIRVKARHDILTEIIAEIKSRPGIIEVLAELHEGTLQVGEDIMVVAIAGDMRENVFPALQDLIQQIKQQITEKEEVIP
jgi:molybdopterin synthase catalytic subunit